MVGESFKSCAVKFFMFYVALEGKFFLGFLGKLSKKAQLGGNTYGSYVQEVEAVNETSESS